LKVKLFKKPEDFDITNAIELASSSKSGGLVIFLGKVRDESHGREVKRLIYEAYEEMAIEEMNKIREEALERFSILDMIIWHRYGELEVGENTILIIASGKHRKEAFEACMWTVNEVKKRVPIWKKEVTNQGEFWIEGNRLIMHKKGH